MYNVEKYIQRCITSVGYQTYSGLMECIIIDDCGTDKSVHMTEQFVSDYNGPINFKIVHHDRNRGLAAARNTAIEHATGEFVVHVDSDDWIEPNTIELLVKRQQETNADIVSCNAIAHYPNNEISFIIEPKYKSLDDMIMQTVQMTMDHVIWRRLIRVSLYKDNNIHAVEGINIGEDHHTLPRLVNFAKKIATIDAYLWHYNCENESSYMQKNKRFNINRYLSDCSSLEILTSHFKDAHLFYNELLKVKYNYINKSLKEADISSNDYNKILCDLQVLQSNSFKIIKKQISTSIIPRYYMIFNSVADSIRNIDFVQNNNNVVKFPKEILLNCSLFDIQKSICLRRLSRYSIIDNIKFYTYIKPLLRDLKRICEVYKMPFEVVFAVHFPRIMQILAICVSPIARFIRTIKD